MSNSVRSHRRQPTRLPHPWDSPGKNTGVGCRFLLQCRKVKSESEVAQLCPTISNPMNCSPLLHPWDFPGKSTGVGRHHLLRSHTLVRNKSTVLTSVCAQSCPNFYNSTDCRLPGSSDHGIFQARILELVAISFSRGSSQPVMRPVSPALTG